MATKRTAGTRRGSTDRVTLARLPALPQLETIDFTGALIGDRDLRQFAVLPCLKPLNLSQTFITNAGLAEVASVASPLELMMGMVMLFRRHASAEAIVDATAASSNPDLLALVFTAWPATFTACYEH